MGDEWDAVDAAGGLTEDACFASGWYDKLHGYVSDFINTTGLAMLETDGPYNGRDCHSTTHAYHHGEQDSIYRQTQQQNNFYTEMRALNVYVNQPDNYFYTGGSRTGMGYDENQYSLPRWHDISISRMGLYDDLYAHLPTQGWMFLPLTPYHGGGEDASFLDHLQEYEWGLAQYLGAGTAACYRGPLLYHDDATKAVLQKWVQFYKKYRSTLIQPVVHLRRPTMQGWDGWLHVNPFQVGGTAEVGLAMIFNPTDVTLQTTISLPLYYTGMDTNVDVSVDGGTALAMTLRRDYSVRVSLSMAPRSIHTIVITPGAKSAHRSEHITLY